MTNTLRAATVVVGSADSFARTRSSESVTSDQTSKPFLSSASTSIRQGAASVLNGFEQSGPRRVDRSQVVQETIRSMPHVAILDNDVEHAATLAGRLRGRQLTLTTHGKLEDALQALRGDHPAWDIMVVNVTDASQPWLAILRRLQEACSSYSSPKTPLFLCTSKIKRHPQFQLLLERLGVRFVYER
jgi:hypothetical protein